MNNIIQIEKLRYVKICGERRLFHNLINNCLVNSENLKPKGSLLDLLLLYFLFRSSPPELFSKVAVLKFRKIPWETPAVVLAILKQLFLGISSTDYCNQKQPPEVL